MDLGIVISLVVGLLSLGIAFIAEGGSLAALLQPTAALIVFGGTIGAIGVSFPTQTLKNVFKVLKVAFSKRENNVKEQIEFFKELSSKTRKNGFLSLEAEINGSDMDIFTKKGLQMVVDGAEPSSIRNSLEIRIQNLSERHRKYSAIFEAAGGYSPTMGIIGTVMGLVQVLSNLSDPTTLGPKIAVAFIATLYGVASANILWLPLASKLKALDHEEILEKELAMEAILLIQEGANPNNLVTRIEGFLQQKEIEGLEQTK